MESESNLSSLGSGSRLPVATQPPSDTTTIQCPECGSQKIWKNGIRYEAYGEFQRYLCRSCAHRFSFSGRSQRSERVQNLQRLILRTKAPLPSTWNRLGDASDTGQAALTSITKSRPKIRCEPSIQDEAVDDMESRTQEMAAGATATTHEDVKSKSVEFAWWMTKEGYSEATILGRSKLLKILAKRGASLYDPETIKTVIAQQKWSEGRKANAVDAYTTFLQMQGAKWTPPVYMKVRKIPFIPTEI